MPGNSLADARAKAKRDAAPPHVPTTCIHDLANRLVCQKCRDVRLPKYLLFGVERNGRL
jgi:hypothetical protein